MATRHLLTLWRTLEHGMHAKGLHTSASQLIKKVAGIDRTDVLLPVKRGEPTSVRRNSG